MEYEIRLAAVPADAVLDDLNASAGLDVGTDGTVTVLVGELDQAALHGLLDRIRRSGVELIGVRRIRRSAG